MAKKSKAISNAKKSRASKSRTRKSAVRPQSQRICNVEPSRNTQNDWSFENAVAARALGAPGAAAAPLAAPVSVDLRAPWWGIGNQETTGSCVGWASADGLARYHFVRAGRLAQNAKLSPRFVWMASKETDEFVNRPETMIEGAGTSLKASLDILRRYGAVPETLLPFKIATNLYLGNENAFFATAASRRIASYFNLQKNLAAWRNWLAAEGPLLVALNVDATWDNATATNGNLNTFQPATTRGGHAVCVVGYTAANRFIVRNSWGTAWGDRGFAYASESYINAAFFNESYGIRI
ncbi:MAG: C1 family peptidase [Alphaproteobacteria bacterium]|nr:C1 family peptidase [Alphaproteobacteria bacterium]